MCWERVKVSKTLHVGARIKVNKAGIEHEEEFKKKRAEHYNMGMLLKHGSQDFEDENDDESTDEEDMEQDS
jgi:hypothetical protein